VKLKDVLSQVNPQNGNLRHSFPPPCGYGLANYGASHALRRGAVHPIRWRKEYGGLRVNQAKRLKGLETENVRLKKLVADQALDIAILKEASSGNF
jgi:hypothetical protein